MKEGIRNLAVLALLSFWYNAGFAAGGEGFLSSEDAQAANAETLLAEVAVFRSIRNGIILSFTQCELGPGSCEPAASSDEVQQLITALDQRIDGLSQRQQSADDSAGLEDVLIAYVDELDGFSGFLEKLGPVSSEESYIGENIDETELFGAEEEEEAATTEAAEEFGDMFADEDEEL